MSATSGSDREQEPAARPSRAWFSWIFGLVVVAGYLGCVIAWQSPYAGGADSSGYMNAARLIGKGAWFEPARSIEGLGPPTWRGYHQQPLGFVAKEEDGSLVPIYPVGVPLHLAALAKFVGLERASIVLNVLLVIASAALMVGLAREMGLPWRWAWAAAAMLWACPLYVLNTSQPMSDLPATVWVLAAVGSAMRTRRSPGWAWAAGFALSVAVLVRPTNVLAIVPVAVALGLRRRAWLGLLLSGVPGALFLAWYNRTLFDGAFATGYGEVGSFFKIAYVAPNLAHFVKWAALLLSPVAMVAAVARIWIHGGRGTRAASGVVLAAWIGAFVGLYAFYWFSGQEWWSLRFILPAFPAVILAAVGALHGATVRWPGKGWKRGWAAAALVAGMAWQVAVGRELNVHRIRHTDEAYLLAAKWMNAHAPADSIVLQMQLSGAFFYYTKFAVARWDTMNSDEWRALQAAASAAGRPIYAALYDFEEEPALARAAGNWRLVQRIRQMSIWEWRADTADDAAR